MGPVVLFDKSFLQGISLDESVWLDAFYLSNVTPLFFVETLADLEKEVAGGRTPEQVVGNLAEKTPESGLPNVHHEVICYSELLGNQLELRGVPFVEGGEPVIRGNRKGLVVKQTPEQSSLHRWRLRQFLEIDRDFARSWRQALSGLDLESAYGQGRAIIERLGRPVDLVEAKSMAVALLQKRGSRYAREGLRFNGWTEKALREVAERWRAAGDPPMAEYAPFTAHVLTVDLFFSIGLGADLISRNRPTNKVDLAYLYYLPFCGVFTSSDKLHARTVPPFLAPDQAFVRGPDLKADLAKLDAHYSVFPAELRARGVMTFAHYPPVESGFLTSELWDKFMAPEWRKRAANPSPPLSKEAEKKIIAEFKRMAEAPRVQEPAAQFSSDDVDSVMLEHVMPTHKGKWRILPPEVGAKPTEAGHPSDPRGAK